MQNKTNTLRTNQSVPSQRYYRSVKYKIDASMMQSTRKDNLTPFKSTRAVSSWRKTQHLWSTAQNLTNLSKNPQTQQQPSDLVQIKRPYLQTWTKLLHSEKDKIQDLPKAMRVHLPQIIDFDPSMFTALDPLPLPFAHIQQGIIQLKSQLPGPKTDMAQIRSDMKAIDQKITKDLEDIQEIADKGFSKLRKMLRQDQVQLQENMMRFKRNCKILKEKDISFKKNFQQTKPRLTVLQDEIFSSRPFELERNSELDEQFPQLYF